MCNLHWCYTFSTVLHLNYTTLGQSESSNFFMYIIMLKTHYTNTKAVFSTTKTLILRFLEIIVLCHYLSLNARVLNREKLTWKFHHCSRHFSNMVATQQIIDNVIVPKHDFLFTKITVPDTASLFKTLCKTIN